MRIEAESAGPYRLTPVIVPEGRHRGRSEGRIEGQQRGELPENLAGQPGKTASRDPDPRLMAIALREYLEQVRPSLRASPCFFANPGGNRSSAVVADVCQSNTGQQRPQLRRRGRHLPPPLAPRLGHEPRAPRRGHPRRPAPDGPLQRRDDLSLASPVRCRPPGRRRPGVPRKLRGCTERSCITDSERRRAARGSVGERPPPVILGSLSVLEDAKAGISRRPSQSLRPIPRSLSKPFS